MKVTGDCSYVLPNPCTGLDNTTYFHVVHALHKPENGFVLPSLQGEVWGHTDDGYTLVSGHDTDVEIVDDVSVSTASLFRHPDGSMIMCHLTIRWNGATQELVVLRLEFHLPREERLTPRIPLVLQHLAETRPGRSCTSYHGGYGTARRPLTSLDHR